MSANIPNIIAGYRNADTDYKAAAQGTIGVVPMPLVISDGTMMQPSASLFPKNVFPTTSNERKANVLQVESVSYALAQKTSVSVAELVKLATGLEPGQQVTFVAIRNQNGVIEVFAPEVNADQYLGEMVAARIVTDAEKIAALPDIALPADAEGVGAFRLAVQDALTQCITATTAALYTIVTLASDWDVSVTNGVVEIIPNVLTYANAFEGSNALEAATNSDYFYAAYGRFVSEYDTERKAWNFSRSQMAINPSVNTDEAYASDNEQTKMAAYGLPFATAMATYMDSKQTATSQFFARKGGDDNTINQ